MKNATSSSDDPADLVSLAKAVIESHGASAEAFAARLRAENSSLQPHQLADRVARRYASLAGSAGAAAGMPSEPDHSNADAAVTGDSVPLLRLQFRMLLEIAAVYGCDPTDHERATELTAFCGPQRGADSARIAMARTGKRLLTQLAEPGGTFAALGLRQRHRQIAHECTPYVGVGVGALTYRTTTMALARQAVNFYDPSAIA